MVSHLGLLSSLGNVAFRFPRFLPRKHRRRRRPFACMQMSVSWSVVRACGNGRVGALLSTSCDHFLPRFRPFYWLSGPVIGSSLSSFSFPSRRRRFFFLLLLLDFSRYRPVCPFSPISLMDCSVSLSLSLSLSAEFYWSPLPSLSGFASLTPSAQPLYWFLDECLPRFAFVSFVFYWIVTAFLVLSGFSSRLKKRFEHGNAE